jgi:hypothetical protein
LEQKVDASGEVDGSGNGEIEDGGVVFDIRVALRGITQTEVFLSGKGADGREYNEITSITTLLRALGIEPVLTSNRLRVVITVLPPQKVQ